MWSKTKKQLESFICDSLKGRIKFHCSNYRIQDGIGRTYITLDGKEIFNMCTLKRDYYGNRKAGVVSQVEFMEVLGEYFHSSIEKCLKSNNLIINILLILDRRIGKRTLLSMKEKIDNTVDIIKYLYNIRCNAEGLDIS